MGSKWKSTRTSLLDEGKGSVFRPCQSAKRPLSTSKVRDPLNIDRGTFILTDPDLEQLLHLLSDGSLPAGQMVRCTKARSMFAMRACRKSVMIGKSLTRNQMIALLRNMGTIDQPWVSVRSRAM
jgi:hypothetical protein